MPRKVRSASNTGTYHVMIRGINQQQIFEEEKDYLKFMSVLSECKEVSGFTLYAYCLMGNHVHLLIRTGAEGLNRIVQRIAGRYVGWFNMKYERTGHLMQGRFKSEPIEDNRYFIACARYIHRNPVKAGLCASAREYRYSSLREYAAGAELIDDSIVSEIMSKEVFLELNELPLNERFIDVEESKEIRVTEEKAVELIEKYSGCKNATEFQRLSQDDQRSAIKKIHQKGVSIRQTVRLCGVSKGLVERYIKTGV